MRDFIHSQHSILTTDWRFNFGRLRTPSSRSLKKPLLGQLEYYWEEKNEKIVGGSSTRLSMIHCASEINSLKRGEFALCGKKQVFVKTPDAVYAQAVWIRFAVRVAVASELAQWRVCWLRAPFSTWRVSAWAPVSALWHALHLLLVCWCTNEIYPTFAKMACVGVSVVTKILFSHCRWITAAVATHRFGGRRRRSQRRTR